ncbi:triose-phosphate isomerase [Corynebacterium pyruviciproducens]|uniref:Triosephosphate isomerase n=1 Tax=Corynebacterium pyruviciproducens TaxID=598660 RepID=A0AAF0YXH2_9CORY|nr:triose-phosphate isomerase [Corynebacterium pyruviciproducens]WOT03253.1 triose-phosphate isomerase [Corynebacterium pyruviciproducens]
MARKPLIAGNWKMNNDHLEATKEVQAFSFALEKHDDYFDKVDAAFLVPFTDIRSVQVFAESEKPKFTYGAQDISTHDKGAYTGEVSGAMLSKLGCTYVVVGHSERREYHGETDELVAEKARVAISNGLTPIICVGESLEVREAGNHVEFVVEQTKKSIEGIENIEDAVIAYEPVWAIGTGKVATPADAQEVCAAIREVVGEGVRILYGGSMKAETAADLIAQKDIDGGLVGGASVHGEDFAKLIANAAESL